MEALRTVAPGVHVLDAPQRFAGIELGARMTVLELEGGLLVHSPVAVDPSVVASLGEVRWVVAPNLFHHLHVGPWAAHATETWAAPGLPQKRGDLTFTGVLDAVGEPFGAEVLVVPLTSFPLTQEVVLHHRPSRTLIVTDLLFNLPRTAPWATRAAMWCAGAYPGVRSSLLERFGMRRAAARRDFAHLLAEDFDRIVLAHGEVVLEGGREAFSRAYRWLWGGRGPDERPAA